MRIRRWIINFTWVVPCFDLFANFLYVELLFWIVCYLLSYMLSCCFDLFATRDVCVSSCPKWQRQFSNTIIFPLFHFQQLSLSASRRFFPIIIVCLCTALTILIIASGVCVQEPEEPFSKYFSTLCFSLPFTLLFFYFFPRRSPAAVVVKVCVETW
jgi:hypothetical protein